jgi:hypothetical protein
MDEHVRFAVAPLDEAITLFVLKPLHRSFSQNQRLLLDDHKPAEPAERARH